MSDHLPENKTAFGFLVYEGEHLPVVRSRRTEHVIGVMGMGLEYIASYTVWQDGMARAENYSQRDWNRLIEKGEVYETTENHEN